MRFQLVRRAGDVASGSRCLGVCTNAQETFAAPGTDSRIALAAGTSKLAKHTCSSCHSCGCKLKFTACLPGCASHSKQLSLIRLQMQPIAQWPSGVSWTTRKRSRSSQIIGALWSLLKMHLLYVHAVGAHGYHIIVACNQAHHAYHAGQKSSRRLITRIGLRSAGTSQRAESR